MEIDQPGSDERRGVGAAVRARAADRRTLEVLRRGDDSFVTSSLEAVSRWGRANSLFLQPFATACCGSELTAGAGPRYGLDRLGVSLPRFSPQRSDLLMVVGTITQRLAPLLKQVYDQMAEPKWVLSMGACASTGGMFNNYALVQGVDQVVPVDVYVPGCPPGPQSLMHGILTLQEKIMSGEIRRSTGVL